MPFIPWMISAKQGLFTRPAHMNKLMYHSIFSDHFLHVCLKHNLTKACSVEVHSIGLVCNKADKMWPILSWMEELESLLADNLLIVYIHECISRYGTIASCGDSWCHVPTYNQPILTPEIFLSQRVLMTVIECANDENMGFKEAVSYIVTKLPRAGKLIAMHILLLLVLGGLVVDRTFLTNATLANVCTKKVSCCLFLLLLQ